MIAPQSWRENLEAALCPHLQGRARGRSSHVSSTVAATLQNILDDLIEAVWT